MNVLNLKKLNLKTFTEQDASDYCQLNNLILDNIIIIYLNVNQLTDISGLKLFKNLQQLFLQNNKIEDISVIQNLNKLKHLDLRYLKLESDQIKYIKFLKKLKSLWCENGFRDMSVLKQLNKDINIIK